MILIYPPAAKACEPPPGIAKISGALNSHGIKHSLIDANLEALQFVINRTQSLTSFPDRWTGRAFRNILKNYSALKNWRTYENIDRYKRALFDLNRAVEKSVENSIILGLANYRHKELSPIRSTDLIRAAEEPEKNPFYPYFSERLSELLKNSTSFLVGFSLNYLSQALCTFAMIGYIRQHFPEMRIVLGGGLVTSWMRKPDWKNPFTGLVDLLIDGPGEIRLLSLMGTDKHIDNYSTPDYDALPLNDYLAPGRIVPYSASSGCYWNRCSFCPEQAEENPYIPVPVEQVISDLEQLIRRNKPSLIHLLDNAVSTKLLKKMAANPLGVPWYGFARISKLLTDPDFCRALKDSGCIMLKLGLESGDQGVLDRMHKGINLETTSLALKTLKKAGIATYVYLLFGTPHETIHEARNTLDFIVKHRNETGFLNLAIFNMPVCGRDTSEFETSSFYEGDLSLYTDFVHPEGWSRRGVRLFLDKEFKRNKAVSEILSKDPPIFTSNHAPLFNMNHG
jgi:radical SAM superfamily enzyme YgiQ (UPF0313 family)